MFRTVIKHTRADTSVPFFNPKNSALVPSFVNGYISENFIKTGKLVNTESQISADGLEIVFTTTWVNQNAYLEWKNDATIKNYLLAAGAQYREENNMQSVILAEEEI